jgi:DNA-binding GntR family transcriptional regulator
VATAEEAALLRIGIADKVLSMERIIAADRAPDVFWRNAIPIALLSNPPPRQAFALSMEDFLEIYCGRRLGYVSVRIRAATADADAAQWLGLSVGMPVLTFGEIYCTSEGEPLACGTAYSTEVPFCLNLVRSRAFSSSGEAHHRQDTMDEHPGE